MCPQSALPPSSLPLSWRVCLLLVPLLCLALKVSDHLVTCLELGNGLHRLIRGLGVKHLHCFGTQTIHVLNELAGGGSGFRGLGGLGVGVQGVWGLVEVWGLGVRVVMGWEFEGLGGVLGGFGV